MNNVCALFRKKLYLESLEIKKIITYCELCLINKKSVALDVTKNNQ